MAILDQSVIKEKELIDDDLQKMWESLQSLKSSVEKDATILENTDFSDVFKLIVSDLSVLSQTADITLLQKTLQSQEKLTASDLDRIIQHFITVKLTHADNASVHLTEASLQKYKQLVTHKAAMDDLLLKITQTPTPEITPIDWQEKEESSSEKDPIPETTDPELVKAKKLLIDREKNPLVEDASKKESSKEEEKKSFWDRAKDSSFGLAYIFGADRMSSAKERVSDTWDTFKEWIGWKKKEKKEDEKEEVSSSQETTTESVAPSVDINKGLTEQERLLRNAYIKQSVIDTTTVPVPIDYKKDKTLLVDKGSPENISFDKNSQSIIMWWAIFKLSFPEFIMNLDSGVPLLGKVDATIKKVTINNVTTSWNEFVISATWTGSAKWIEKSQDLTVNISKEKFYDILKPYLEGNTMKYDTSLEFDGQKVSLKLDVAWNIDPSSSTIENDSQNFVSYKKEIYNSYSEQEKKYLDNISTHSADMYTAAVTWLDKERLPTLLQEYDGNLLSWLDGATLAILGKQFGTVSDLIDDTALQKLGTMTNDVLETIVDFLSKGEDIPVIKWIAKILKRPFEKLQWLIPNGNEQKQNDLRSTIEKQLKDDPSIKSDIEKVVKQFSLVRFYFTEKRAILEEKWMDIWSFEKLSLPAAADILQKQSLLDSSISTKMTLWLESNKVSVVLENLIKSTDPKSDLSAERWKIQFNYKTQELESRWEKTKIEVSPDGKRYTIKWLDIVFRDLKSALWLANMSNRMIHQIGWVSSLTSKVNNYFVYEGRLLYQWLYVDSRGLNTDRLVSASAFKDNVSWWDFDYGLNYTKYLNNRVKLF